MDVVLWRGQVWRGPISIDSNLFGHPLCIYIVLLSGLSFMFVAYLFLISCCFIAHLSQSYELKEEKGLSATMSTVWRKLNQPFQPNIPHLQQQSRTKFLSHSFSRDKLHLWEIFWEIEGWGRVGWVGGVERYLLRFLCVPKAPEQLKNINPDSCFLLHLTYSA